jgi:hypothetical protein
MFVGKWKYCSPEHLGMLKKEERIDGRADLYSYGIVLYEMLTGVPPFVADTPHRYLMMHSAENPKRFGELDAATNIPSELEEIVFKSLEKDRERRFGSARDFSRALAKVLPALPDEARLPAAEGYQDEPTRQRPLTSGEPSSMKSTVTKKSITEETPIPSVIEEQAAFERLKGAPDGTSAQDQETVRGQELIATMVTGGMPAGEESTESAASELLRTGRTGELERKPRGGVALATWLGGGALVVLLVVLAVVFWPSTPEPSEQADAGVVVGAETEASTDSMTVAAPGRLGLQAFPWGEVVSIRNLGTGENVELGSPIVTPGSIELAPGQYEVTLRHPDIRDVQTQSVEVRAGVTEVVAFNLRNDPGYPDFGGGVK